MITKTLLPTYSSYVPQWDSVIRPASPPLLTASPRRLPVLPANSKFLTSGSDPKPRSQIDQQTNRNHAPKDSVSRMIVNPFPCLLDLIPSLPTATRTMAELKQQTGEMFRWWQSACSEASNTAGCVTYSEMALLLNNAVLNEFVCEEMEMC